MVVVVAVEIAKRGSLRFAAVLRMDTMMDETSRGRGCALVSVNVKGCFEKARNAVCVKIERRLRMI